MKTKNKVLAMVEIAVVLCSVLVVALPAIAADQTSQEVTASANTITTTSEDDYVLGVYGNANEDDTIDMRDLTYVKLIFFGKKPETELADAKYDGKINPLDFIQIKLIIVGKEKEITIVDSKEKTVTVRKPIKRVVIITRYTAEAFKIIGAEDKVVGVSQQVIGDKIFFPELCELPSIGSVGKPDCEAILKLEPDLVIGYGSYGESVEELEPHVKVVYFKFIHPAEISEEVEKLGYIFDKEDEAKEYVDFVKGLMDTINDKVGGISEKDKPRVYMAWWGIYAACNKRSGGGQICAMAGGTNIAAELSSPYVDAEWVIEQNPDIIIVRATGMKLTDIDIAASNGYDEDDPTEVIALIDNVMNRPELANVNSVKNRRVYVISQDITARPSYFVAVTYFAKWFYPDLDLDPQAIHQEYLNRFQHMLDFNVYEHGVFAYPLPK